jgi:hypothetical protein
MVFTKIHHVPDGIYYKPLVLAVQSVEKDRKQPEIHQKSLPNGSLTM